MAKRLGFTILFSILGTSALLSACGDDEDRTGDMAGGEAGSSAGTKTGGSSPGGSSAGKSSSGSSHGGEAQAGQSGLAGGESVGGQGGEPSQAGAAGSGMGGESGHAGAPEGGSAGSGGAPVDGGASGMAGAAGGDNPQVDYACGDSSITRKLCSAYVAAACHTLPACEGDPPPDPCCTDCITRDCPTCVGDSNIERSSFSACPACLAEYDRYLSCGIEPFEAGQLSDGIECYDTYGPTVREARCLEIFNSATSCTSHLIEHPCPDSWPL